MLKNIAARKNITLCRIPKEGKFLEIIPVLKEALV
jgi:hypothetical protein